MSEAKDFYKFFSWNNLAFVFFISCYCSCLCATWSGKTEMCRCSATPSSQFPEKIWFVHHNCMEALHKKWSFPFRISSVNLTKSPWNRGFCHIYWKNPYWKTSFFVQWEPRLCQLPHGYNLERFQYLFCNSACTFANVYYLWNLR